MRPWRWTDLAVMLALAAIYFVAARIGLRLAFVAEQVTVVWPPTGIALAAILVFGMRIWPGIYLGAFITNVTVNATAPAALGMALGNTLEAVTGAWLLQRVAFDNSLGRIKDVFAFVVFGVLLATTVSATLGPISLCLARVQHWSAYWNLWMVWWLGDAVGALVVAPFVLTWASERFDRRDSDTVVEATALLLALLTIGSVVFGIFFPGVTADHPLEYAVFPLVIWAALRFGQRGTSAVIVITSVLAILGTVRGLGPFSRVAIHESLILLQVFMAAVAATGLVLGAAMNERNRADRRRSVDQAVTHILAESMSLETATPRVLQTVCESLGWDVGGLWRVDHDGHVLRCLEIWHRPICACPDFEEMSRRMVFEKGSGLPGRVWANGQPMWIADVTRDSNFPRAPIADREGLHAAFAFPILLGNEVFGVIEFFSCEIRAPDLPVLQMFAAVGSQIGQFIERKRSEAALQDADRRKDEFLAMLAHELRNPLAPIRNALEILKHSPGDEAAAAPARDMMQRQLQHLVRLVDDLLDVSRIMRGRIDLHKETVDLATIITRAVEQSRPLLDAEGHHLAIDLPEQPVHLHGDLLRLAQVFANLLNNAAKYSERGGHIGIKGSMDGKELVVRVTDDGIGMSRDLVPHVFELFVQSDRSMARSQGGLGIGLTLVKRLVEMHDGSVSAHSAGPGLGSEFTVRLPVLAATAAHAPAGDGDAASRKASARGRRILVVDDNVDAAESLSVLLRMKGHSVATAHDGPEALSQAESFSPEVVLLDLGLPGMNGYDVARDLRRKPGRDKLTVVAITGYGQEEDRRRSQEAGIDHHLVKPVDPGELHALLTPV
jgi:signal transduction histidine kinase/integral membrane sensor domain MASE1